MIPGTRDDRGRQDQERTCELLPWYIHKTLSEPERREVERHLPTCVSCQRDLPPWQAVAAAVAGQSGGEWSLPPQHLRRARARIRAAAPRRAGRSGPWSALARRAESLRQAPLALRWALALQLALAAGFGVALVQQWTAAPAALYQTFADPAQPDSAPGWQVRVVFSAELRVGELRELLQPERAAIVHGPTPLGVYTVQVASAEQQARLLQRLRAHAQVQFAEPVNAGAAR